MSIKCLCGCGQIFSEFGVVKLNISDRLLFEATEPHTCGWWIRDEVYEWLLCNVGSGGQHGQWVENQSWMWLSSFDGKPVDNTISFLDPKSALLFKLAWGGI